MLQFGAFSADSFQVKKASRLLAMVLTLLMAVVVFPAERVEAAPSTWWNNAYTYRAPISVVTNAALPAGYQVSVTLNHAGLVSSSQSLASGDDVRLVHWNGTSWDSEQDRVLAIGSSWNSSSTTIYFKLAGALGASVTNLDYYLYYGNPSAPAPLANASNVYDLFDDFSSGSLNASKWNAYGPTGLVKSYAGTFFTSRVATRATRTRLRSSSRRRPTPLTRS